MESKIDYMICKNCKYYDPKNQKCLNKKVVSRKGLATNEPILETHSCAEWEEKEKIDLVELHRNIIDILKKYMDLREDYYSLIALWIIGTYFHNNFSTYPYLFFNAMRGSGKSRLLNLITTLSKEGQMLGSMTEAVLFRTKGTLCIDEFEGVGRKGNENLRELLNSAYKRGLKVKRMVKKKTNEGEQQVVEEFEVYRPIVMANIWGMENVLSDRCIPIILEKSSNPSVTKLQEDFDENEEIKNIVSVLNPSETYTSDTYTTLFKYTKKLWNDYILGHDVSEVYSVSSVSSVSKLFNKIDKTNLLGRDLELFFPLFVVGKECGVLDETIAVSEKIIGDRKELDSEENWDILLIDFLSEYDRPYYVAVNVLTNEFRDSSGITSEKLNPTWVGRALRRLALIKDKRNTGRSREVMINIEKAKEKIKMFK